MSPATDADYLARIGRILNAKRLLRYKIITRREAMEMMDAPATDTDLASPVFQLNKERILNRVFRTPEEVAREAGWTFTDPTDTDLAYSRAQDEHRYRCTGLGEPQ